MAFLGFGTYGACFKVTNEIGPVGADKSGRQIFIQTIDKLYGRPLGMTVTSEWADTNLVQRLIVGEPMRTTFRFVVDSSLSAPSVEYGQQFLASSFRSFFAQFNPPPNATLSLRDDRKIPLSDFIGRLDQMNAASVEDMLAALGFRRFDIVFRAKTVFMADLKEISRPNAKWVGE